MLSSGTLVLPRTTAPMAPVGPAPAVGTARRWPSVVVVVLAAVLAVAAWLPFLHDPLTPDEAGFLLLGRHWAPGSSLYGDYWVDRPPLLVWLFALAGHVTTLGRVGVQGAPAVKLLGAVASGISVLLTGLLAGLVGRPGRSRLVAPLVALALLSSPFLGMPETDGEVLAVPFVLLGIACLVAALRHPRGRRALALAAAAGASAMAAALVKQNMIDVFVFAAAVPLGAHGRVGSLRGRAVAFVGGSLGALLLLLAAAGVRGTSPTGLWDAVVTFRLGAWGVIGSSASAATPARVGHLGSAFLISGAALLLVVLAPLALADRWRQRSAAGDAAVRAPASPDLTWSALCTVGWEVVGVALGGSYWWHYLTGMVPGLVLLAALVASGRHRRWARACLAYLLVVTAVAWTYWVVRPADPSPDGEVSAYLRAHSRPTDGVVVAFGHPDIVAASGLTSPYRYLWSLPVRVRDPGLRDLERVMSGPRPPRWLVVEGAGLGSWGLDAQAAQRYLVHHYGEQVSYGDWHVWRHEEGVGR